MRSQLRYAGRFIFPAFLLLTAQCGGKSKSQDVQISVAPINPIVFTSDFTYTAPSGTPVQVKGPWFSYSVQIENDSDSDLTLIGLHIDVTGTDGTGTSTTVSTDYVPAQDNISTDLLNCTYTDFGQFQKKGDTTGDHGYSYSLYETPTSNNPTCPKGIVTFYAPGNPLPANTAGTIRYTVVIKPVGYFGDRGKPTDRFVGQATIYTQ